MQVFIKKKLLIKSLGKIHSIVEKRNSIPILSNAKIEAVEGKIIMAATDMDLYTVDEVEAEVIKPGVTTVPMHTLFDIVKKLPDEATIELFFDNEQSGSGLIIKSEKVECSLPMMSPSDFPVFAELKDGKKFKFKASDLRSLLTTTKYAISNEETRYYLNGVFMHFIQEAGKNILRAVATDVHRLAMAEIELHDDSRDVDGIILPKKTVLELIKLLENDNSDVTMTIYQNRVAFQLDHLKMSSKLIDGKFPDYVKAISATNDKILEIETKALLDAVDLVTTVSFDKTKAVKFHASRDKVALSVHNNINGFSKAFQELPASYDNSPVEIAFNSRYVMDVLSVVSGSKVRFLFSHNNSAVSVQDLSATSAIHVIMPMQI